MAVRCIELPRACDDEFSGCGTAIGHPGTHERMNAPFPAGPGEPPALRPGPQQRRAAVSSPPCRSRCSSHLDPDMHDILLEVVDLLRQVYRAPDGLVFPLQATGIVGHGDRHRQPARAGRHGDRRASRGFFGRRIAEIAERNGADVVRGRGRLGRVGRPTSACSRRSTSIRTRALRRRRARRDLDRRRASARRARRGAGRRGGDTLLMVDCVTSLGGDRARLRRAGASTSPTRARRSASPRLPACRRSRSPTARSSASRTRTQPGAVLVRPRPAREVLDPAPGRLPPHRADPAHLRAPRGAARRARGGARGALGAPRRGRRLLPAPRSATAGSSCSPTPTTSSRRSPPCAVPEGVDGKAVQTRDPARARDRGRRRPRARRARRCGGSA